MKSHRSYMLQAISLARRASLETCPNPMVGAVIVKNSKIVSKAWHQRAGEEHAEVLAINTAGEKAIGSDLYVCLEPCSHYGKTPPCVNKIIESGIKRVFYAVKDPNSKSSGGERILKEAGIEVISGIEETAAKNLNQAWFFLQENKKRPFITLKLAVSFDNKLSAAYGAETQISSPLSKRLVHKLRARSHAVLVGANTLKIDRPQLTNRLYHNKFVKNHQPIKVLLDSRLEADFDSQTFTGGKVIIATSPEATKDKIKQAEDLGHEVMILSAKSQGLCLQELFFELKQKEIYSVLAEGGGQLAKSLLYEKLVDKLYLFTSKNKLHGEGPSFDFNSLAEENGNFGLSLCSKQKVSNDKLQIYSR